MPSPSSYCPCASSPNNQQGHCPWTHSAARKTYISSFFPHETWRNETEPTGAMKTKKKPGEKARFLLRPFSIVFPGCKSIRSAVFHTAQPVVRQCRSQLAKIQSSSANACLRYALFHWEMVWMIHIAISGIGCRVDDPAGVWGETPHRLPTIQIYNITIYFHLYPLNKSFS